MSLSSLLSKGPGPTLEYLPQPDNEHLAETLVAFANADGGTVLLGVGPGGTVKGELLSEEIESALRLALVACRPPVRTEWEQMETQQGVVVAIRVPRSTELHSLADGRVLLRVSNENRPLGGEAIRQLAATKSSGDFETESIAGATRADLDDDLITEYLAKREERQRRPAAVVREQLLRDIGALDLAGQPTVSGLLLFGRQPQAILPQCGLLFVRFTGNEPRGPEGLPGYGRREEIGGPLPRLIERAWQVIWSEMRVEAVVRGLVREEKTEYPPFAVREALVNAVAHRDY
ncbi:MAG: putative DNA binding domain-containing protein, partial [Anaerolineae bacterium]|nr:putative DNA binding domain-containing protein [Anaerolineae bacterium]